MLPLEEIPSTPLWRGFYAHNRLLRLYLLASHIITRDLLFASKNRSSTLSLGGLAPRRILVCNGAHLGDVVIASSALPVLRSRFPTAEIGFLCGSWAQELVKAHPLVNYVHVADHWVLNRSKLSLTRRIARTVRTSLQSISEIRRLKYDLSIDFYIFYPNLAEIPWAAGVPVRIGYGSGGFGAFFTHCFELPFRLNAHMLDYHGYLLANLGCADEEVKKMRPSLDYLVRPLSQVKAAMNDGESLEPGAYIVLHIGAGDPHKEWPVTNWRTVAAELCGQYKLVFTGRGRRESELIAQVIDGLPNSINLCNRLDLSSFASVVSKARLVIGLDSVAVHIASALGVPSVALWSGIYPSLFKPRFGRCDVIIGSVPCVPCLRGCGERECIRSVSAQTVLARVNRALEATSPDGLAKA